MRLPFARISVLKLSFIPNTVSVWSLLLHAHVLYYYFISIHT